MRQGVVFSPGAAAKIRQAVTSCDLTGRNRAILGGGGGAAAAPLPMPFDLSIAPVTVSGVVEQHAMLRIANHWVGNGDDQIDIDYDRNQSLYSAIYRGDDHWDAGALTENSPTMGFCLYVVKTVAWPPSGIKVVLKWGVATAATVRLAMAAIPAPSGTGSSSGDVLGTLVCLPLGAVSLASPAVSQLWRGVVSIPQVEETTVLTDFQYDLATHKLQKKTRTVLLPQGLPETAFTTITGGTAEAHS